IYTTYRYMWEKVSFSSLWSEIGNNLGGKNRNSFLAYYNKLSTFNWEIALQNKSEKEKLSIRYAVPTFTIDTLLQVINISNIQKNIIAMDRQVREGRLFLQINNSGVEYLSQPDLVLKIIEDFSKNNIKMHIDEIFPTVLQAKAQDKSKIIQSDNYQKNKVIFQDKASIASIHLLDPQPGHLVCDLCAAPGIKTKFIAQQSNRQSKIVAGDFHSQRLEEMIKFLKTYNLSNTHIIHWDGIQPPVKQGIFDKVLLDAPCTGSGTFSSNPELKWRQSEQFLKRNVFLQEKLLNAAVKLLKPGGILIYSTCSLYPEEGEYQINRILSSQVKMGPTPSWLPPSYHINGTPLKGMGRFTPAEHGTNGFFISKLIKTESKN
ncbi:MAG: RsmB/NOP family class I SAM-dependent RNA methyltransferase, partial [Candidatus Hodarchaeales archaeon]